MKRIIIILCIALLPSLLFGQIARRPLTNRWESFTADTVNATDLYLLNGVELGLINNILWVDGEFTTSGITATGSINAPYTTISAALTAAVSGDLIYVVPGSYTEHLTFTEDSITLMSTGGPEVTFVEATVVSATGIDVVDYTTIIGFTFTGDSGGAIVELETGETNVRLIGNTFNITGANTFGISGGAAGSDSLFIQGNKFLTNSGDGAIWLNKTNTNVVVDGNYFFGIDSTSGYAIQAAGIHTAQFTNNIVDGYYASGIFIHTATSTSSGSYNVVIDGNIVKNCSYGIRLGHSSQTVNMDSIKVTNNTLYWNTIGVYIADDATVLANTFDIIDNRFISNTTNYVNDHSSLVPRSLSSWLDDNLDISGDLFAGDQHWEQATITDDAQLSDVSADYMLVYLIAEETAGNTATLDLGTTAGASDIFINQTFTASTVTTMTINKVFSFSAATELYLNDDDGSSSWNSASLNVYLVFQKITQ